MTAVLAIDPGNVDSAYALIDARTCQPLLVDKISNHELRDLLRSGLHEGAHVAIETIASYGMAVGQEVFDTCVWIGRFQEVAGGDAVHLVKRKEVKMHLCQSNAAKDGNIIQALVDRFAYGQKNRGKGTKAAPGWFYGFSSDRWQAYALAVQQADSLR